MANKPIVTVNITLQTATVSRAGFGTPLFIASHRAFQERVRTYGSLSAVAEDFDTSSTAYVAAQGVFSNTPSVTALKIGRREADAIVTPLSVVENSVHKFTITVNDGDSLAVEVTAAALEDAEDVATAMKAAIDADVPVAAHVTATVVGVGAAGTLEIAATTTTDVFSLTLNSGNSITSKASTETATDALLAVQAEDDDFYFVMGDDHTETYVLAMAAAVEAQTLMYFVSTQEDDSITNAYSESETDIIAKLKQSAYKRTVSVWSQVADTSFPEANFVGVNAPFSPDERAVVWDGRELSGVPLSKNSFGNELTGTQELNLFNRNANYVTTTAAGNRILGGQTASGDWIDDIRTQDTITARVKEGQEALILNQNGGKVPGGPRGIALCEAALNNDLLPFVASDALESFSTDSSNATIDQGTRKLSGLTFEGVLSGAILRVVIDGILVNQS